MWQYLIIVLLIKSTNADDRSLSTTPIQCYSCASTLPSSIDATAKATMKILIRNNYNLPSVHSHCTDPNDVEFPTVQQLTCSIGDQCAKITVTQQGLLFIVRGCKTTMFKSNIAPRESTYPCNNEQSPSICYCNTNLCNNVINNRTCSLLIMIVLPMFIAFINDHL